MSIETVWKRNFDREFKMTFQFLLGEDQNIIWNATTKICNAENPRTVYPHAQCTVDQNHIICKIEEEYILAFKIKQQEKQIHFIEFYRLDGRTS